METRTESRRGFLGRLAKLGALAAVPLLGTTAQAGRTWRRGWGGYYGGWGYPRYRITTRRRFYGGGYYGGGWGGGYYGGGWGGGYYGGGYIAPAPIVPATPYIAPAPVVPYYRGYGPIPLMQNTPSVLPDALSLLEV